MSDEPKMTPSEFAAWIAKRPHVAHLTLERVCEVCGKTFVAKRRTAKHCSSACTQRAYYRRQRLPKEKPPEDAAALNVEPAALMRGEEPDS